MAEQPQDQPPRQPPLPEPPDPSDTAGATDPAAAAETVRCDVTGETLPLDETVVLRGYRVGPRGKQILLDRLQGGEPLPGESERPGVLRRFGCMFLDGLIMWAVSVALILPASFLLGVGAAGFFTPDTTETAAMFLGAGSTLISTLIGVLYFTLMHAHRGQSVGKMAGRIKLVQYDGNPVTTGQAFWRAMLYTGLNFIPAFFMLFAIVSLALAEALSMIANTAVAVFFIVNVIFALLDSQRQRALHDRITGTRVIMTHYWQTQN